MTGVKEAAIFSQRRPAAIKPSLVLHAGPSQRLLMRSRHREKGSSVITHWCEGEAGCPIYVAWLSDLSVIKGHPQPAHEVFSLSWLNSTQGTLTDQADILTI